MAVPYIELKMLHRFLRFAEGLDNRLDQLYKGGLPAIINIKIVIAYLFVSV